MRNSERLESIYEREYGSIALVAGATAGSWQVGEEVAQEAFVEAMHRWDDVKTMDRPGAWIRRVAINRAIDRRRRAKRERQIVDQLGPNLVLVGTDSRSDLWALVASLPPAQRAAVVMHYHDGYSTGEIADVLDVSVSAVTTNLHKARQRLGELLGGER